MLWSDLGHLVQRGLGEAMASQYEYWSTAELKAAVDALPDAAFGALAQTLTKGAASLSDALRDLESAWAAARVCWRGSAAEAAQEAAARTSQWVGHVASLSSRTAVNASDMQLAVGAAKAAMPAQVVATYRPGGPPVPPAQQVAAQQQQMRASQAVQALTGTALETTARGPEPGEWPSPQQGTVAGGPVFTSAGRPGGGTGMARFGDMGGRGRSRWWRCRWFGRRRVGVVLVLVPAAAGARHGRRGCRRLGTPA
jgi:hypothetical protein